MAGAPLLTVVPNLGTIVLKMDILKVFFSSKTRIKLLNLFLVNPKGRFYLREIQRQLKEAITPLRRELFKLEAVGFLIREKVGNLTYYSVNQKFPIYEELKRIIFKTEGLGDILRQSFKDLRNLKLAFIYGSAAKGGERLDSDIDLMIIGRVNIRKLAPIIRILEGKVGREINYTVFDEAEWNKKKKEKNSFILNVLKNKKIFLIGSEKNV